MYDTDPREQKVMSSEVVHFLEASILPEMEHGRPDFDVPHTLTVVKYVYGIVAATPELHLDLPVLIIAAYAHDWGYAGLFEAGKAVSLEENVNKKAAHMEIGSRKIAALLTDARFDFLSDEQKQRIVHLVAIHDKVRELKDPDELVLMEADTLGMTDSEAVRPTHTFEEYQGVRTWTERERVPRFITDYSKAQYQELAARRQRYYEDLAQKN